MGVPPEHQEFARQTKLSRVVDPMPTFQSLSRQTGVPVDTLVHHALVRWAAGGAEALLALEPQVLRDLIAARQREDWATVGGIIDWLEAGLLTRTATPLPSATPLLLDLPRSSNHTPETTGLRLSHKPRRVASLCRELTMGLCRRTSNQSRQASIAERRPYRALVQTVPTRDCDFHTGPCLCATASAKPSTLRSRAQDPRRGRFPRAKRSS